MVEQEGGDSPPKDRVFPKELADWLAVHAPQEMAAVARSLHKEMLPLLAAGLSLGEQPRVGDDSNGRRDPVLKGMKECLGLEKLSKDYVEDPAYVSVWKASILYISKCLTVGKDGREGWPQNGGIPLTNILRATNADLFEFFREISATLNVLEPKLAEIVGGSPPIEKCIREAVGECKINLVLLVILARKFKDLFCKIFSVEPKHAPSKKAFQVGWLLMMIVKTEVLPTPTLVNCFHLLVCICNFLLINTPKALWRSGTFDNQDGKPLNTLHILSEMSKIKGAEELQHMEDVMQHVDAAVKRLLVSNDAIYKLISEDHEESQVQPSATFYKGLISDEGILLDQCLKFLNQEYEALYHASREMDERDFIVEGFIPEESSPATPQLPLPLPCNTFTSFPMNHASATTNSPSTDLHHQALGPMSRCVQSPPPIRLLESTPSATPVSEALKSVAWLKRTTANQAPEPSKKLKEYLGICDKSIGTRIQQRAYQIAHLVFPKSPSATVPIPMNWAKIQTAGIQGIVVYYQVLESVLVGEEERSHKQNFSSLLSSNSFHVALLWCSFEIIASTYKIASLEFPKLLHKLQLKLFDIGKVIEPFVRHITLPTDLKRHLFLIEERIIESLAWQPGSSIYPLIAGCCQLRPPTSSPCTSMPATPTNSSVVPPLRFSPPKQPLSGLSPGARSSTSAFKAFTSPLRKVCGDSSSPWSTPKGLQGPLPKRILKQGSADSKKNPARTVLEDFIRKVMKLSAFRLIDMKSVLTLSGVDASSIVRQVFNVIHHALYEQTHLFYNRHLDQILLSSFYGVCKVNKLNIDFKDIIAHYQFHPQNQPEVYKAVVLEQSDPDLQPKKWGDIIEFYNYVFLPSMRSFLLNTSPVVALSAPSPAEVTCDTPETRRMRLDSTRSSPFSQQAVSHFLLEDKPIGRIPNVTVSPLKTPTKTEIGGACSARTMHAFVGKTTNRYQTPSQELGAITARLNQSAAAGAGIQGDLSLPTVSPACFGNSSMDVASRVKLEPGGGVSGNEASPGPILGSSGIGLRSRCSPGTVQGVKTEPDVGQSGMEDNTRSPSVVSSTGSGSPVVEGSTKLVAGRRLASSVHGREEPQPKRRKIGRKGPWKPPVERCDAMREDGLSSAT